MGLLPALLPVGPEWALPAEGLCSPSRQGDTAGLWPEFGVLAGENKESEPPRAVVRGHEDLSWCQPRQGEGGHGFINCWPIGSRSEQIGV